MHTIHPTAETSAIGVLGLGLLSRNLILAIARQGYPVAGYDPDPVRNSELRDRMQGLPVTASRTIEDFVKLLCRPRAILMLLQGGPHLEKIHLDLCSHLDAGDTVVDGGSYHHIFTPKRWRFFAEHGVHYVAVGFAAAGHGHEYGCRSLYPAFQETCSRIRPIFESAATTASGEPCVTFVGQRVVQHLVLLENGNDRTIKS